MVKIIMSLLPVRYRELLKLALRITAYTDKGSLLEVADILADGKVSAREWTRLGKSLGIIDKYGK